MDQGDGADSESLVPSRRVARRARRRTTPATSNTESPDPLTTALSALLALQVSNEAIVTEIRELRRRITSLASKIELLDHQLTEGAAMGKLRSVETPKVETPKVETPAKKSSPPRKRVAKPAAPETT